MPRREVPAPMRRWQDIDQPVMPIIYFRRRRIRAGMAMKFAMKEAGIQPEQVDHINAHETGTHHNDLFEAKSDPLCTGKGGRNGSDQSYQINGFKSYMLLQLVLLR